MAQHPTIVFGIDGGHFELITDWLESGELPNVKRAIETGVSADLESVLPPVTSPNWKAYSTGKNPGKIGIFWWENIDTDAERVYYPSERKHINTEFWELVGEKDGAGVIGVPTTYPPKSIDSFLVSGAPDGKNTDFTHPSQLEDQLKDQYGYRVTMRNRLKDDVDAAAEEILDLIDQRFSVARDLFEDREISFLQITTFYINSLQHYFWDDEYTRKGWSIIDRHLGYWFEKDYNVILMSDHGSNKIETAFHINSWLEQEGYLSLDKGVSDWLYQMGIHTDRLVRLAQGLGVRDLAERLAPPSLLKYLPNEEGEFSKAGKMENIDWDQTDVVASGQGPIYLTMGSDHPEYEPLREELVQKLGSIEDETGRSIVDCVYRGEELYSGSFEKDAPDLVADQSEGIHIPGRIGGSKVFSTPESNGWRAENKREGLFVATGPIFTQGEIDQLSILDLAPTILHLHDCPVPTDMDGEIKKSVFAEGSEPQTRQTKRLSGNEVEAQKIRKIARKNEL